MFFDELISGLKRMHIELTVLYKNVQSHFMNVPIDEVIDIIMEYARSIDTNLSIPLFMFNQIRRICACKIQFIFNGQYHHQIDGVLIGSPIIPVLVDIFMGYLEMKAQTTFSSLSVYRKFVDGEG